MSIRKKIWVTGATGQLGNELKVISHNYPQYEFQFSSRTDVDLTDIDSLSACIETIKPDYCINTAAYTAVDQAEKEPGLAFNINADVPGRLAELSNKKNFRLIHFSTDYVFNGRSTGPYTESEATDPQGVYGSSKLEGEQQVMGFNPDSIIIRTSWVYSSFGKNFVKTMLRLMNERDTIGVVNDQSGSPTYAADLADATLRIITRIDQDPSAINAGGIFHYCNEGIITWYEFAVAIKELASLGCNILPITTDEYPTPARRPAYSALNCSHIVETFGLELKPWKESLAACISLLNRS